MNQSISSENPRERTSLYLQEVSRPMGKAIRGLSDRTNNELSSTSLNIFERLPYEAVKTSPLVKLPTEIRLIIYELALTPPRSNPRYDRSEAKWIFAQHRPSDLLRTCKFIHDEAMPASYKVSIYRLKCQKGVSHMHSLFQQRVQHATFKFIHNVELQMSIQNKTLSNSSKPKYLQRLKRLPQMKSCHIRFSERSKSTIWCQCCLPLPAHFIEHLQNAVRQGQQITFSVNRSLLNVKAGQFIGRLSDPSTGGKIFRQHRRALIGGQFHKLEIGKPFEGEFLTVHHSFMLELATRMKDCFGPGTWSIDPDGCDALERVTFRA